MNHEKPKRKIRDILRVATAGSVDDGKSTLLGRILVDSGNIYKDQIKGTESSHTFFAHITDGLRAERQQGITIDVAYRYITTSNRYIILADSPGHQQYTRNMATAAADADVGIILVDASKGLLNQTRRHVFIASLMGIPRLVLAVNKMDLVGFKEEVFDKIVTDFFDFSSRLNILDIRAIPVSALMGDNVVAESSNTPWYKGPTIFDYLCNVYVGSDANTVDFRFPVQIPLHVDSRRLLAGRVSSGSISVGEEVLILPSQQQSRVESIISIDSFGDEQKLERAEVFSSVALQLHDQVDVPRGSMIVRRNNLPRQVSCIGALLVWMDVAPMDPSVTYLLLHTSNMTRCRVRMLFYVIDVDCLSRIKQETLSLNEIGRVEIETAEEIFVDPYTRNRANGGFILIHPETNLTIAAGVVIDQHPVWSTDGEGRVVSQNVHTESSRVSEKRRNQRFGHKPHTFWLCGLAASGKSTLAIGFEEYLFNKGYGVYRLDGDNVRQGLNRDLGFSQNDRTENIRRIAEVTRLFNDAGLVCIVAAITPLEVHRNLARKIIGEDKFTLVYVDTPLKVCESRDPHGIYKKARSGEIRSFTGISAPFEDPVDCQLRINTSVITIDESLGKLISLWEQASCQESV